MNDQCSMANIEWFGRLTNDEVKAGPLLVVKWFMEAVCGGG
jgi:hypothetical protein